VRGLDEQVVALVRGQVGGIILGSMFLLVGLAACGVAAVRRRRGVGVLVWFGIFSGMYGVRLLASSSAAFSLLPRFMWDWALYVVAILTYLILIPALMFWLELSLGKIQLFIWGLLMAAIAVAAAGVFVALTARNPYRLQQCAGDRLYRSACRRERGAEPG